MLYYSDDRGDTFYERVNGTNPLVVTAIDIDSPNLCIQSPGFIFKSSDLGENLASRVCTTYTSSGGIQRDWGEADLWFAGVNDGSTNGAIYISEDNGETWEISPGITSPIYCLMPDSSYESDYLFAAGSSSFHISSDNGNNWSHVSIPGATNIQAMDINPDDASIIIIADNGTGAWRSLDRGSNWSSINNGLTNLNVSRIKFCPGQSNIALIGTEAGVFKTTNINAAAPTWFAANQGISSGSITAIDFHPTDNSIICLGVDDNGIGKTFISPDTARSWIEIDNGLNGLLVNDIATDIDYPDTFYVTTDDGIYKLKNPVKSGTITSIETWGQGKVIINGDVTVERGAELDIVSPCTVLVTYDYDRTTSGAEPGQSEIIVDGSLTAHGTSSSPIVFKSSNPINPSPKD